MTLFKSKPNDKKNNPDYETDSANTLAESAERSRLAIEKARSLIAEDLVDSVGTIREIRSEGEEETNRLRAAIHMLKLGGLEVEQHEHKGSVQIIGLPERKPIDVETARGPAVGIPPKK